MELGFTTLALFMHDHKEIIKLAKLHGFEIIEILGEDPFWEKDKFTFIFSNVHFQILQKECFKPALSK